MAKLVHYYSFTETTLVAVICLKFP